MRCRLLRWTILGFACLWFGMLLPVHQRGQIQLPGSGASPSAARCCRAHEGKQQPRVPANRGNCAVCQLILGLHAPPPVTWYVERLGLVEVLAAERQADIAPCAIILPFHGRAPPAV